MAKDIKIKKKKISVPAIILFLALAFYSLTLLIMYGWGFSMSLKDSLGQNSFTKNWVWLPKGAPWDWAWSNYANALDLFKMQRFLNGSLIVLNVGDMFLNSIIYSTLGPFITLFTTWVMAYLCSQFPGKASNFIYRLNLVLMMIPIVGSLPSALRIYTKLGLYDNWGYVVVSSITFVGSNFLIFYAVLSGINKELKEAAQIDGAGNFQIMMRIMFPLTITMFGVLFMNSFIANWNTYMTMIIWLPSKPSLAWGLYSVSNTTNTSAMLPVKVAASMIVMLPMLAIFIIFRNKIIGNVTIGAFK